MPSFKYKTNKKIIVDDKSITTLDNRHREMQLYFSNVENVIIPGLLNEKKNLQKLFEKNDNHNINDINDNDNQNSGSSNGIKNENKIKIPIEKQLEIKDRLAEIKIELRTHKSNIKQYYLNNSKYIFDYFENKKEISNGNNKTKILNSFFNPTLLSKISLIRPILL